MMPRVALVATMAMMLGACGHGHFDNKDYASMNKIPMRSVCVGRMMVDLPKGAPLDWQQQFDYAKVSRLPGNIDDAQKFWALVGQRKAELQKPTTINPKGALQTYKTIGDNASIMQYRPLDVTFDATYTERYLWLGRWGYRYTGGILSDREAVDLLPRIEKTFGQVVSINNYDPPAQPGFCIDGAMVTGKIGPIWSSPDATIPGWKDVTVNVIAREDDGSRAPLSWQRGGRKPPPITPYGDLKMIESWADESKHSGAEDRVVDFEVLRKSDQSLAGMSGEQIAVKAKLANGQEWYRFEWNSTNDAARPAKSGFTVDLEAGDQQYTSNYAPPPSQDDLLALWDAVLDSVKPRAGAGR